MNSKNNSSDNCILNSSTSNDKNKSLDKDMKSSETNNIVLSSAIGGAVIGGLGGIPGAVIGGLIGLAIGLNKKNKDEDK